MSLGTFGYKIMVKTILIHGLLFANTKFVEPVA